MKISRNLFHRIFFCILLYWIIEIFEDLYFTRYCGNALQSRCGGIFNNHVIANCPQNVPIKNFENRLIIGEHIGYDKVGSFFETQCSYSTGSSGC